MEKSKKRSILTGILIVVMGLVIVFGLTSCGSAKFECAGKTFVYDKWESTSELDESQKMMISNNALETFGITQFVFDTDGSYFCKNTETGAVGSEGNWEIVDKTIVLTNSEGKQGILVIVGTEFYVTQQVSGGITLHVYYKLAWLKAENFL